MEFFHFQRDIRFMRHSRILNIISLTVFVLAVVLLATRGLAFSIEFTGGTVLEVSYPQAAPIEEVREKLVELLPKAETQVQTFGSSRDILIRLPAQVEAPADLAQRVFAGIQNLGAGGSAELRRVEVVGPQVGDELAADGLKALLVVILGITIYLAMRFEWKFSVAAIIANLHDVVIILGFFALFQWEFNLSVLAAILAVLGYSVNESVVVADRIRENFRKMRKATVTEVIDNAITRTMSRTIITHGTTEAVVLSMLLFGGPVLHGFAMALTIGIVFGIYSSVFVMAPLAMMLGIQREDLLPKVRKPTDEDVVSN